MNDNEFRIRSREELDAHYGPGGPVEVADRWLRHVLEQHDLDAAWSLTDGGLRRLLVGAWFDANRSHPLLVGQDREAFIEALSEDEPDHPLWPGFAETQIDEFATNWDWMDFEHFGWGGHPRLISPDREIVILVETKSGGEIVQKAEARRGMGFVMRHVDGRWLVAGFEAEVQE